MGFQCVPQILGIQRERSTRKGSAAKGKHRAVGPGILLEAMDERKTDSETFHPDASPENRYHVADGAEPSAWSVWDDLEALAEAHPLRARGGKTRAVRRDTVVAAQVIFKPPAAVTATWDRATYDRFMADAEDVMGAIVPEIFGRPHLLAYADHMDEWEPEEDAAVRDARSRGLMAGAHRHETWSCYDEGSLRWVGGQVGSTKFYDRINRQFAPLMRQRGWDVDDPVMTDGEPDRAAAISARERAGERGLSTNQYRQKKRAEAALDEALDLAIQAGTSRAKDEREARAARAERDRSLADAKRMLAAYQTFSDAADAAKAEADDAARQRDAALDALDEASLALEGEAAAATQASDLAADAMAAAADAIAERDRAASERDAAGRARDAARAELDKARKQVRHQRDLARWLGPEGGGVRHETGGPNEWIEPSVRTIRQERDAEKERLDKEAAGQRKALEELEAQAAAQQKSLDALKAQAGKAAADVKARSDALDKEMADKQDAYQRLQELLKKAYGDRDEAREELDRLDQAKRDAAADLEVASSRGPLRLADVAAAVVTAASDLLARAGFDRAAGWLRARAEAVCRDAAERLAPELAPRALADAPEDDDEPSYDDGYGL